MPKAATAKVIELRPARKPRKVAKRKGPDEWRAINRAARVKDGRSVLLAVPDPRRRGGLTVIEAYWCVKTRTWWPANCASGVPGCEPVADTYGEPAQWMPMPAAPFKQAA
jgi:hypothetical protein